MKGDDIIAVEKSLEPEAWAQLWTLRITVSIRTRLGWAEEEVKGPGRQPSFCKCELRGAWGASFSWDRPSSYLEAETTELAEMTQVVTSGKGRAEPTVPHIRGSIHWVLIPKPRL